MMDEIEESDLSHLQEADVNLLLLRSVRALWALSAAIFTLHLSYSSRPLLILRPADVRSMHAALDTLRVHCAFLI
jgi:hypothetical protein